MLSVSDSSSINHNSKRKVFVLVNITLTQDGNILTVPRHFCHLCKNKGADQLCSNCTSDQRLCFLY